MFRRIKLTMALHFFACSFFSTNHHQDVSAVRKQGRHLLSFFDDPSRNHLAQFRDQDLLCRKDALKDGTLSMLPIGCLLVGFDYTSCFSKELRISTCSRRSKGQRLLRSPGRENEATSGAQ